MPDLGNLSRNRVDLYDVPETVRDSYGQTSQTATLIASGLAADIQQLKGTEAVAVRQTRQELATATHKVTLHYLGPGIVIRPTMKLIAHTRIGDRVLNILSADNTWDLTNDWVLVCEEKIGATS